MERVQSVQIRRAGEPVEGEPDFGAVMRGIRRRKWWIIGTTLAAFLLTSAIVSIATPRYTAEAKILLESQDNYFTRPGKELAAQQAALDPEAVQSQVQLVTSRDLARQAVVKLDLLGNPEFDPLASGLSPVTRLLVLLGLQRDPREMSPEDRVLNTFYDRLTVYPVAKTRVLTIEFVSRDPAFAARAANTIAELYIGLQETAKKQNAKAAGDWLGPNIDALRAKVAEAEAKVEAFRAKSGLLVGNNNVTITGQQLAELNTQLGNARSVQADAQAKAKLIRELIRQGRIAEIADVANNDLIRTIAQQRVTLRAQLALESRALLPGHPRIQELTAQLANVDAALRDAAEKAARGLENNARIAGARVEALTASLETQKRTVATGNDEAVQLRALEREAAAARDQLESFLQKYREATARDTGSASPADARIISRAAPPLLPSFPKKVPTVIIGTLAGFLLSLAIVVSGELLSSRASAPPLRYASRAPELTDRRQAPDTARHAVEPPIIARPPAREADRKTHEEIAADADVTDLARYIVTAKPKAHAACVLVCGIDRGSGATTVAIELARALAGDGRAIIVDLDFGGPGLDRFVGDDETPGLTDLVSGTRSFTDVIHRDRGSRLHVLPAGHRAQGEEADSERLNLVIDALVATYDYIVLDGAPLADSDLSLDLAGWTDAAILVTAGLRGSRATRTAVDTLIDAGAADVQVVAPDVEAPPKGKELSAA